jgi:hypothetical protein
MSREDRSRRVGDRLGRGPGIRGARTGLARPPRRPAARLGPWLVAAVATAAAAAPLGAQDVLPGIDVWTTPGGGTTFDDLAASPIPAGFFDPGSDPFDGRIVFRGDPLPDLGPPSSPPLFPIDTIVERLAPAPMPGPSTIPIEIVALSLVSAQPITVTYNGGQNPELWDVKACLSSVAPQPHGSMTIAGTCPGGGTFGSTLPVVPKLVFTRQNPPQTRVLDPAPQVTLDFLTGRWVYQPDVVLQVLRLPAGKLTDGDCNGLQDPPLPPTSNFAPGVWDLSCEPACVTPPPMPQVKVLSTEDQLLASHGILPAQQKPPDGDGDGIGDDADNCPLLFNPRQCDVDDDAVGDPCDNCVYRANPCQEDVNGNNVGDVCEDEVFYDGFERGDLRAWEDCGP